MTKEIKTCVVVQGNIRQRTSEILTFMQDHFDHVILSTWDDETPNSIPTGRFELILTAKPSIAGYSNRNYQRLSTAIGIRRAAQLGATHVLKWRTDMLPTKLNVSLLLKWSSYKVPLGFSSRLVTCAFRNLSVKQDWFSTIPDLFAFGDISLMQMLWDDKSFDYSEQMNIPSIMTDQMGQDWLKRSDVAGLYCAEAELYAVFKHRLQIHLNCKITHNEIAKNYMRLFNHNILGICWFGVGGKFRTITQALQHPWWTESIWKNGTPKINELGYPENTLIQKFRRKYLTPWVQKLELKKQNEWYSKTFNNY